MAGPSRVRKSMTLEEFLKLPEDKPYLEYIDGRIEAKALPKTKHSIITLRLAERFNDFAEPAGLGLAFPELRCVYAGRAIVADVVFLLTDHFPIDEHGELGGEYFGTPDIHVEINSPDQSAQRAHRKLLHSTANGCPLGLFIHPEHRTVDVYRPGQKPERLAPDGVIEGEPVLPGFRLPVAEVFGWLRVRVQPPGLPPAPGAPHP